MQEVLRPLRTLTAHCSSLSSSGPRRLLLPPSDTSARPSGATHGHIRTAWAPDWSESVSHFFVCCFIYLFFNFLSASINTVALPVTTSALVVFILLPLAQAQEVSLQQLCCPMIWLQSTSTCCLSEPVLVQTDSCLIFLSLRNPMSSAAFQIWSGFPQKLLKQTQDVTQKKHLLCYG